MGWRETSVDKDRGKPAARSRSAPNLTSEQWDSPLKIRFAPDSPLEGEGFETSVPLAKVSLDPREQKGPEVPRRSRGKRW